LRAGTYKSKRIEAITQALMPRNPTAQNSDEGRPEIFSRIFCLLAAVQYQKAGCIELPFSCY